MMPYSCSVSADWAASRLSGLMLARFRSWFQPGGGSSGLGDNGLSEKQVWVDFVEIRVTVVMAVALLKAFDDDV